MNHITNMLDLHTGLTVTLAVAGFFGAFIMHGMRKDIEEVKALASKAHAIEVLMATHYITKDSHDRSMDLLMKLLESNNATQDKKMDALFRKLDIIENRLGGYIEKTNTK